MPHERCCRRWTRETALEIGMSWHFSSCCQPSWWSTVSWEIRIHCQKCESYSTNWRCSCKTKTIRAWNLLSHFQIHQLGMWHRGSAGEKALNCLLLEFEPAQDCSTHVLFLLCLEVFYRISWFQTHQLFSSEEKFRQSQHFYSLDLSHSSSANISACLDAFSIPALALAQKTWTQNATSREHLPGWTTSTKSQEMSGVVNSWNFELSRFIVIFPIFKCVHKC